MQHVLDIHSEFLQPVPVGFLAELDLRCGRQGPALQWATAPPDIRHRFLFYEPTPTLIEALLTSSDTTRRRSSCSTMR